MLIEGSELLFLSGCSAVEAARMPRPRRACRPAVSPSTVPTLVSSWRDKASESFRIHFSTQTVIKTGLCATKTCAWAAAAAVLQL
jgi:hypothetical protein